jgi:hypothetical protein
VRKIFLGKYTGRIYACLILSIFKFKQHENTTSPDLSISSLSIHPKKTQPPLRTVFSLTERSFGRTPLEPAVGPVRLGALAARRLLLRRGGRKERAGREGWSENCDGKRKTKGEKGKLSLSYIVPIDPVIFEARSCGP